MRPGHPVLDRVGSMVEEPAFVPHLSGIRNLRLWWEASGADWADAALDDALAIAGLGDHIERRVKTYSHGMRQRLGLARCLLGRPDLLVLDEPSNGLDPGEMREIRELVRRLADAGASILLSSHLLAEVEQVCSHVVVMDRGRRVAAGTVADLVGASSSAYLEVDDVGAAERVLAALPGIRSVRVEPPGLAVDLDGTARRTVVAALVHAGVGVETVTSRHRLEDAFLGLLAEESA
jgi:ABC-2 type transport system ATP-binding protein